MTGAGRTAEAPYRPGHAASVVGQLFGFLLIAWVVWRILDGDVLGGVWTAFIGWFLNGAAGSTRQQQTLSEDLRGMRVRQLMNPDVRSANRAS